jgi:tetratricopeptide (TPR) repeat protein
MFFLKRLVLVLVLVSLPSLAYSAKKKDTTTIDVIRQIESNLIYNQDVSSMSSVSGVDIDRGWDAERYKYEAKQLAAEVKSVSKESKIIELERLAYSALQKGQTEVAINLYKKALKKNPNNSYSLFGLASAYQQLGQYRQAKPIYLKLLEVFPGNEQVIANLLAIVTEETPHDSVPLLQAMAERHPNSAFINAQTSVAFNNIGDYDNGIKYLNRAIKLDRGNIQYQYNLAVLYDRMGRSDDAVRMYNEIIRSVKYDKQLGHSVPVSRLRERVKMLNARG